MLHELIIKDKNISSRELDNIITASVDVVCIPSVFLKKFTEYSNIITLSALIDYPYGLSDTRIRTHETIYAVRSGAKIVDFVINNSLITDNQIGDIIDDIRICSKSIKNKNVKTRIIFEYTMFPISTILDVSKEIIENTNISGIITSTGTMPQEPNDDVILCHKLIKETFVDVVSCSCWDVRYINFLKSINISGIRFLSINSLNSMINSNFGV